MNDTRSVVLTKVPEVTLLSWIIAPYPAFILVCVFAFRHRPATQGH